MPTIIDLTVNVPIAFTPELLILAPFILRLLRAQVKRRKKRRSRRR